MEKRYGVWVWNNKGESSYRGEAVQQDNGCIRIEFESKPGFYVWLLPDEEEFQEQPTIAENWGEETKPWGSGLARKIAS